MSLTKIKGPFGGVFKIIFKIKNQKQFFLEF